MMDRRPILASLQRWGYDVYVDAPYGVERVDIVGRKRADAPEPMPALVAVVCAEALTPELIQRGRRAQTFADVVVCAVAEYPVIERPETIAVAATQGHQDAVEAGVGVLWLRLDAVGAQHGLAVQVTFGIKAVVSANPQRPPCPHVRAAMTKTLDWFDRLAPYCPVRGGDVIVPRHLILGPGQEN